MLLPLRLLELLTPLCTRVAGTFIMLLSSAALGATTCVECHQAAVRGIADGHRFAERPCARCHRGDESAPEIAQAHAGLIAFPGDLSNAEEICGGCHVVQVRGVAGSDMHTGTGMVRVTRESLGTETDSAIAPTLQRLGDGVADSLLRKLCASCHLGQPKELHHLDPVHDRGGGCLACHVNAYPADAHPSLSVRVEDSRCFGCHSRSGRISLNYAGLAEVDPLPATTAQGAQEVLQLPDGRRVKRRTPDIHHGAGLACVDCHTGAGLMGLAKSRTAKNTDIACADCHDNRRPRVTRSNWPATHRAMLGRIPFEATPDQRFLTTASGTPLWHIELTADGQVLLHRKLGGAPLAIPQVNSTHRPLSDAHATLSCDACHATWAPQCYGCHLGYEPSGEQWDHAEHGVTPGAWQELRWDIRNAPPPLGRRGDGTVDVFIPGMIMTVAHPAWLEDRFVRRFAPLSPHTTGSARQCTDCHASPAALGLGTGQLIATAAGWRFEPAHPPLADGLAADAWTALGRPAPLPGVDGSRPFAHEEIDRLLEAGRTDGPPLSGEN